MSTTCVYDLVKLIIDSKSMPIFNDGDVMEGQEEHVRERVEIPLLDLLKMLDSIRVKG